MEGENGSAKATELPQQQQSEEPAETNGHVEANGTAMNGTSLHGLSNGAVAMNGNGSGPTSPPRLTTMQTSEADYETNFESVEEERLLKLMRANVVKLNRETKGVDDSTLRRFLRARQRKVDKATDMFMEHFEWRRTFVPLGYVPESEIVNELGAEKVYLQGRDKFGLPIGVIQARKHDAKKRNLEEFKKYCVYNFDKCVASMYPGEEKFSVIVDLHGLAYKNLDPRGWTVVFDFLQAHYPERIGKIFLIHAPYIFWGAWKIVNKFIDKRTRDKVRGALRRFIRQFSEIGFKLKTDESALVILPRTLGGYHLMTLKEPLYQKYAILLTLNSFFQILFVDDKHLEEILLKEIDREQLPKFCGGELDLVLIQDATTPNWPPKSIC